jgi:hypothetical protein
MVTTAMKPKFILCLRAHSTIGGDNYQLLSTTDLLNTNWDLGQIKVS